MDTPVERLGLNRLPRSLAVLVCLVAAIFFMFASDAWAQNKQGSASAGELQKINQQLSIIARQLQVRLDAIEKRLGKMEKRLNERVASNAKQPAKKAAKKQDTPRRKKNTIVPGSPTVCPEGCAYKNLRRAIDAAQPGATITVAPGRAAMCAVVHKRLRIVGLKAASGKRAHLIGTACAGKAAFVIEARDVVIEGFEISNIRVADRNGACFRIGKTGVNVILKDIYCHDSETGVLGGGAFGTTTILNSVFERNGANKGQAHGIYVFSGEGLIVRNSRIVSSKQLGHTLKSGAFRTVIEDSVLAALNGQNSRAMDIYGGGELIVRRSVIQQGKHSDNHEFIGFALEENRQNPGPHKIVLEDNWIIYDDLQRCCRWLFKAKVLGPFAVRGNRIVGLTGVHEPSIADQVKKDNRFFADRGEADLPAYDGTLASLPKLAGAGKK